MICYFSVVMVIITLFLSSIVYKYFVFDLKESLLVLESDMVIVCHQQFEFIFYDEEKR